MHCGYILQKRRYHTWYQNGKKGTWTFEGWDKTGEFVIDENTTITGSWTFKADPVKPTDPSNPETDKPGTPGTPGTSDTVNSGQPETPETIDPDSIKQRIENKRTNAAAGVIPKTGDVMSTSLYVGAMALIGSALLALAMGLKKYKTQ